VIAIAWKAQQRLYRIWRRLDGQRGERRKVVAVAVARQLAGFCWAIVNYDQDAQPARELKEFTQMSTAADHRCTPTAAARGSTAGAGSIRPARSASPTPGRDATTATKQRRRLVAGTCDLATGIQARSPNRKSLSPGERGKGTHKTVVSVEVV